MMKTTRDTRSLNIVRSQSGQSLMLALLIMFLLVFIGGVFISIIARNMFRAKRSSDVLTSDYLAEAGIHYADDQLTYGADGADWRPIPNFPGVVRDLSAGSTPEDIDARINGGTALPLSDYPIIRDPDYYWLIRGFSRFTYGKGRFLLRVSYEPRQDDPLSKFIKIEAIGRMGVVDQNDPTTWATDQPIRLRSEKVAYKSIGITDYARFVTNKDRRPDEMPLGSPGFVTSFGEWHGDSNNNSKVDPSEVDGAPIRVNGDLRWYGKNYLWLNPDRGDNVEIAGDIQHDIYSTQNSPEATLVKVNKDYLAEESKSPNFSTIPLISGRDVGSYRDGNLNPDASGRPRAVTRLDPPLIDAKGAVNRIGRYRDLTRNSGEWKQDSSNNWFNTGYYGWGNGVYINNRDDIQTESNMYTLRSNWTQPGSDYWVGPYYTPPGIIITLTPYDLDDDNNDQNPLTGVPDMIITHDSGPGQPRYNWYGPDGNLLTPTGERMIMPYPKNGIIFAEGNIRIKGTLPPIDAQSGGPRWSNQITVVSGGTIYIEGNIIKYPKDGEGKLLEPDDPKQSAIALLATDNVCVNTTQFFGPVREVLMAGSGGEYFEVSPDQTFWMDFAFGIDPFAEQTDKYNYRYDNGDQAPINLYLRHTSDRDAGLCYVNMLVNYPLGNALTDPLYVFGTSANPNDQHPFYPLGDARANVWQWLADNNYVSYNWWFNNSQHTAAEVQKAPNWECAAFRLDLVDPLKNRSRYQFFTEPGVYNQIGFQLDQSIGAGTGMVNYWISRAAVAPSDIRIEAIMYAQNGSFFVIPGEWFNPNPNDTREAFYNSDPDPDRRTRPLGVDNEWPFYGQPLDVRIVIYGSVSENIPAPIGDTRDWMDKWGWIPGRHGSAGLNSSADVLTEYRSLLDPDNLLGLEDPDDPKSWRKQGLTLIYDPQLSYPGVEDPVSHRIVPLRTDEYGRILPVAPKLPVSTQMLYFGEPA